MPKMGNHLYGCDDCLTVCPWNKFETPTQEPSFMPRAELQAPMLADVLDLDDVTFRKVFAGSPIKRSGRDRVVRNALIAAGNSGQTRMLPMVEALQHDDAKWFVNR
eukprot:UN17886